jgi:hypothetical protein
MLLLPGQRRRKSKSRSVDDIQVVCEYPNTFQDQHVLESPQLFSNPSESRDEILFKGVRLVAPKNSIIIK